MNWSKAKSIIIVVLVFTNLFIIGMTLLRYEKVQSDDSDVYQYTEDILKENNIYIDCELPDAVGRMHAITVTYSKYDANLVEREIRDSEKLAADKRSDDDYRNAADSFVSECGYMDEGVKFFSVDKSEQAVSVNYKNYYNDIPLEECYMVVRFQDGMIIDFDRRWMEFVEAVGTKINITLPVSSLLSFMTEVREEYDVSQEIHITDMYMTYWIDSYNVDNVLYDTAFPAWCVRYNEGKIKYISAIVQ